MEEMTYHTNKQINNGEGPSRGVNDQGVAGLGVEEESLGPTRDRERAGSFQGLLHWAF